MRGLPLTRGLKARAAAAVLAMLVLAGGMLFAIETFDRVAAAQIREIRQHEQEITLAERLRWSGEVIVSAGRGYLISGDAALLRRLLAVREEFEAGLDALAARTPGSGDEQFLRDVDRDARAFMQAQESLAATRTLDTRTSELTQRFERELIPKQRALGRSLDRLVERKEDAVDAMYLAGEQALDTLRIRFHAGLAAALVMALLAIVHFARCLAEAFQAERAAVEAARRAAVSRDDLMGVVAHDLRTPLHSIGLRAALVDKLDTAPAVREQARSIATIVRSMESLIRSMLDVASMQAGRFMVTPAPCDMHRIVRDCLVMLDPLAASKRIRVTREMPSLELTLIADSERILQVLVNLVGNAIKFSPEETEVRLGIELCRDHLRCSVIDQGPGIDPGNLPQVFDRFWKRQPEAKAGSGLGLFIARNIVEAHGGRIWAESDGAHGTTFRFTLPRVATGAARARHPVPDCQNDW